MKAIPLTHNRP